MGASDLLLALTIAISSLGQTDQKSEFELQNELYQTRWGTSLERKFSELPTKATVEGFRVPYSGYIYPDTEGGTINALMKYDRAFNGGRGTASSHERWDTASGREVTTQVQSYGFFGRRSQVVYSSHIPYWHGHCNGWTAAAIRHPEPENSVTKNGVVFTPKDVKALLAEIYIYSDIDYLAGEYGNVAPDMLHLTVANWLGRENCPIAMEATPGKEKWNYPIYGFAISSGARGNNQVEVKMNIAYSNYSNQELDQSPRLKLVKYFHYMLNLNTAGEVVGGYYFRDSSQIDLLWAPIAPIPGAQPGNERGNPYINIDEVLALTNESVSQDLLSKWFTDRASRDAALGTAVAREADTLPEVNESAEAVSTDEPADEQTDIDTDVTAAGR